MCLHTYYFMIPNLQILNPFLRNEPRKLNETSPRLMNEDKQIAHTLPCHAIGKKIDILFNLKLWKEHKEKDDTRQLSNLSFCPFQSIRLNVPACSFSREIPFLSLDSYELYSYWKIPHAFFLRKRSQKRAFKLS